MTPLRANSIPRVDYILIKVLELPAPLFLRVSGSIVMVPSRGELEKNSRQEDSKDQGRGCKNLGWEQGERLYCLALCQLGTS